MDVNNGYSMNSSQVSKKDNFKMDLTTSLSKHDHSYQNM